MKRKIIIINYSLVLVVLFGVLFQSIHSFEHLVKQLNSKHCLHKYNHSHTSITHSHDDFDDCLVCEYSFSNYIPTEFYAFEAVFFPHITTCFFGYGEKLVFFSGSLTLTRGPPSNIV